MKYHSTSEWGPGNIINVIYIIFLGLYLVWQYRQQQSAGFILLLVEKLQDIKVPSKFGRKVAYGFV